MTRTKYSLEALIQGSHFDHGFEDKVFSYIKKVDLNAMNRFQMRKTNSNTCQLYSINHKLCTFYITYCLSANI